MSNQTEYVVGAFHPVSLYNTGLPIKDALLEDLVDKAIKTEVNQILRIKKRVNKIYLRPLGAGMRYMVWKKAALKYGMDLSYSDPPLSLTRLKLDSIILVWDGKSDMVRKLHKESESKFIRVKIIDFRTRWALVSKELIGENRHFAPRTQASGRTEEEGYTVDKVTDQGTTKQIYLLPSGER